MLLRYLQQLLVRQLHTLQTLQEQKHHPLCQHLLLLTQQQL
jgi:hypothetical protein